MDYAQHLAGFANILEQKRLVTGLELDGFAGSCWGRHRLPGAYIGISPF